MKKALLVFAALTIVMASVAFATETRVTTLGENYDTLRDEHNIWLYPSTINLYPNMVGGIVSEGTFGAAGGHWQMGDAVIGAYFDAYETPVWYSQNDYRWLEQRINLFYGRQLGEMPFGVRLSLWGNGDKQENDPQDDGDPNYDNSYSRFEAALGLTLMEGKADISAGFGFTSFTEERNYLDPFLSDAADEDVFQAYDNLATDGSFDFDIRARYWHEMNEKWTLIPHASFSSRSLTTLDQDVYWYSTTGDATPEAAGFWDRVEWEESGNEFVFGLGTNYQASEKVMTVTDLGIRFGSMESKTTVVSAPNATPATSQETIIEDSPTYIPYIKAGLEGDIKSWLDVRIGMVSEWHSSKSELSGSFRSGETLTPRDFESNTEYGVNTRTYIGTGFHFGSFHIDTELNARFLNDGPYFITGRPDSDYYGTPSDWATQVAFRYDFN